jgi:hypothetical protein
MIVLFHNESAMLNTSMFVHFSHAPCWNCCNNVPPKARNDISKRFSAGEWMRCTCSALGIPAQKELIERFSPRCIQVRVTLVFELASCLCCDFGLSHC